MYSPFVNLATAIIKFWSILFFLFFWVKTFFYRNTLPQTLRQFFPSEGEYIHCIYLKLHTKPPLTSEVFCCYWCVIEKFRFLSEYLAIIYPYLILSFCHCTISCFYPSSFFFLQQLCSNNFTNKILTKFNTGKSDKIFKKCNCRLSLWIYRKKIDDRWHPSNKGTTTSIQFDFRSAIDRLQDRFWHN